MVFLSKTNNATEPSFNNEPVARYEGRTLDELSCVRILWKHGILFSEKKGRARKNSPLSFLSRKEEIPANFKNIVLTDRAQPGNKCWGRIDFLVNYCGYKLIDERT